MRYLGLVLAVVGVILSLAAVSPAASVGERYPDLVPLPKYLKDRRVETSGGQTFLRFSTGIGNFGDGPVEVRGERSSTSDPMTAIQRIYLTGGGFTEQTIGTFSYHPVHNHWHLDYFGKYELVDSGGNVVAANEKAGFCLLDVERIKPPLDGASNQPVYTTCNQGDSSALTIGPHGISRGWTDIYRKYLADQSINITGVPAGSYTLRVTADPLGRISESNEGNNVTTVPVTIR